MTHKQRWVWWQGHRNWARFLARQGKLKRPVSEHQRRLTYWRADEWSYGKWTHQERNP